MTCTSRLLGVLLPIVVAIAAGPSFAQRATTEQAFERFEEALRPMVDEGSLSPQGIGPILLVGATPAFEETRVWFPAAALESVLRLFGTGNVRVCEACMNPRVHVDNGRLEHNSILSLPEIARIDAELRGSGAPARSAIWLEETPGGIAVRLVALENAQVLFAGNFDGPQRERIRSSNLYNATLELGRRLRGESLTHIFIDAAVLPNQHISFDIAEQFGDSNKNLAGITFSLFDPLIGVGAVYYRVIPAAWNLTVGVQASVPTALTTILNQGNGPPPTGFLEPIVTGVLVARIPIPYTSFAVVGMVSTNLRLCIGITMMNVSFLPLLP